MATAAEVKSQIDTSVTNITASAGITPTTLGAQLKAIVDFAQSLLGSSGTVTILHTANFTAANGTAIGSYTPETGAPWTNRLSTMAIQSNKATTTGTGPWSIHTLLSQQNLKATIVMQNATGATTGVYKQIGVHMNTGETDGIIINIGPESIQAYDVVSGTPTAFGGNQVISDGGTEHTYEVTANGTALTLKRDGTTVLNAITMAAHSGNYLNINTGGSAAGDFTLNSIDVVSV